VLNLYTHFILNIVEAFRVTHHLLLQSSNGEAKIYLQRAQITLRKSIEQCGMLILKTICTWTGLIQHKAALRQNI
jgi:hypothetical protein